MADENKNQTTSAPASPTPVSTQAEPAPGTRASKAVWDEFVVTHVVPSGYEFDGLELRKQGKE